jgi:hypothetical protein
MIIRLSRSCRVRQVMPNYISIFPHFIPHFEYIITTHKYVSSWAFHPHLKGYYRHSCPAKNMTLRPAQQLKRVFMVIAAMSAFVTPDTLKIIKSRMAI